MNREIKFRYWDTFNEVMQYSEPERWEDYLSKFFIEFDSAKEGQNIPILMQYTGLKDKNGVEIYEGDIIVHNTSPETHDVVTFQNGAFYAGYLSFDERANEHSDSIHDWKIIGNIYSNPELINNNLTK